MMRYFRYALLGAVALALIVVALANRGMVRVQLLPDEVAWLVAANPAREVPLFVVMFAGILAGLVIGFIWEWIREAGERAAAARQAREMERLKLELRRLKGERNRGRDEVAALLEEVG
ncbi:MAG: lipopolysaccharide assembly protein LapA domain-containing protein [Roseovarius sp.]